MGCGCGLKKSSSVSRVNTIVKNVSTKSPVKPATQKKATPKRRIIRRPI